EFFYSFLQENAQLIPNIVKIHRVLVSGRKREEGMLVHGGGTARFETIAGAGVWGECKRLEEIADEKTRLIKIDTDGFDLPILASSLEFLALRRPCLFFENCVKDAETITMADQLVEDLAAIGYQHFAVFDDPGLHLVSTTDLDVLHSLNRYLYKVITGKQERNLYNYDVLCLPVEDQDVFDAVMGYYREY